MTDEELVKAAIDYLPASYAPYSGFHVAAALLDDKGRVWLGCNIENASYGATNCAERTAFFKAVSDGRDAEGKLPGFIKIAIVGGKGTTEEALTDFASPCGICRQVMREFCRPKEFEIILYAGGRYLKATLEELLPQSFGPEVLL